ncbi:MAG: MliC family protein [Marinobacter sp.]
MFIRYIPFSLLVIAAGCALSTPENTASSEPHSTPDSFIAYHCESGTAIQAAYPAHRKAVVKYKEQMLRMNLAVSADGSRYVGDGLEWWTSGSGVGSEGTLFRHETAGKIVERCKQHR